jgi:hypothetical protein
MRILRHAQIDVTMNVYTGVSDAKTIQALKRPGRQLGSQALRYLWRYGIEGGHPQSSQVACDLGRGGRI